MALKPLPELLKEYANFRHYYRGELQYQTDSGFTFNVPIDELENAKVGQTEKAVIFMRWIRPQYIVYTQAMERNR